MKAKLSLANLIRNKEIEFHSHGRKLDTNLSRYGKYNQNLVKQLLKTAGNKIVVKGNGLEDYLASGENLYSLTQFLVEMQYVGSRKYSDHAIHVDVDIEKFNKHYKKPEKEELINGLNQVVGDASSWVPEMPYFEKCWNFALDLAVGGMVGYPGHEHPRDEQSFRYVISQHAENYMVGTRKQLQRYKQYALDALHNTISLAEEFKNNPDLLFKDPYELHGLEFGSRSARIIAENIVHFSNSFST